MSKQPDSLFVILLNAYGIYATGRKLWNSESIYVSLLCAKPYVSLCFLIHICLFGFIVSKIITQCWLLCAYFWHAYILCIFLDVWYFHFFFSINITICLQQSITVCTFTSQLPPTNPSSNRTNLPVIITNKITSNLQ